MARTRLERIGAYLTSVFYGAAQARIHHERFGTLARVAAGLVIESLAANGIRTGTVVDLGCGSGIYAAVLVTAGFDVVGVDLSADMVALARSHTPEARIELGSIHDFELPNAVAITALGEILNYATDDRAGLDAFARLAARAHAALTPGGVFVFDVSTPGRGTYERFHDGDDWALGMHSVETGDTLTRDIVIFSRRDDGTFDRVDERHVLRLYEPDAITHILTTAGFGVAVRAAYGDMPPLPGWKVFTATR
jgi:SAM-dependent methyltransferase